LRCRFAAIAGELCAVSEPPIVLFCHLPKTGGSAVSKMLASLITGEKHIELDPTIGSPQADVILARPGYVSGHYHHLDSLKLVRDLKMKNVVLLTQLRNPISHIISQYYHLKTPAASLNHPNPEDMNGLVECAMNNDLAEFLTRCDDGNFPGHFDNPQTRFIINEPYGRIDAAALEDAICCLDQFSLVGIYEYFGYSASRMTEMLGLDGPIEIPRVMTNPEKKSNPETIDRQSIKEIIRLTEYDAMLYEHFRVVIEEHLLRAPEVGGLNTESALPSINTNMAVSVTDCVRVSRSMVVVNGRFGEEVMVLGEDLFIHAPHPSGGATRLSNIGCLLNGQNRFSACLILDHPASPAVVFVINIVSGSRQLVCAETRVVYGAPVFVSYGFPSHYGHVDIAIETRVASPANGNDFAWARVGAPALDCAAQSDRSEWL
jgi:Sulfotransferase family